MTEIKVPDAGGATMNMVDVGGFIQPIFLKPGTEIKDIFDNVPNYKFRDNDLMLCTFAKTGTNWLFEILMMILNKSAKRIKTNKVLTMLECVTAAEADQQPSPRVVNCHFPPRFLPLAGMKEKQIKTVLCLRNPKDTAVSYYNHMKGIKVYGYDGKWEDWLPVYVQGKLEYGRYSEYLLEWQREVQNDPGFPLHIMFYEDLKMNGRDELDKLLKFLDIQLDEQLKNDIIDMCGFKKMAEEKGKDKISEAFIKPDFKFFRKGQVGDWKNWFTVAQNEMFDKCWKNETKDLELLKFKYTHDNV
ncbi:sulfotransferase 1C4-like [Mercenaria mercenaria]|uniref:sulfotransferase 1C4-like n=1 Tax=Mercenaria mercenaria TaxID=6596 RepID=UPI00234F806A|nr:sulfotransferase 1C4-like [Mercenaria mercenaria]XP_053376364.1 sulfotransferase 1C4-like [Mercenaria mercenaria]XP_053376365.1 sulfotransferase 1C4-like [Mercenaria mercenaria]XP_053376366.1 sulfotransferase 1C4-like [Mercenaria mercenaria]